MGIGEYVAQRDWQRLRFDPKDFDRVLFLADTYLDDTSSLPEKSDELLARRSKTTYVDSAQPYLWEQALDFRRRLGEHLLDLVPKGYESKFSLQDEKDVAVSLMPTGQGSESNVYIVTMKVETPLGYREAVFRIDPKNRKIGYKLRPLQSLEVALVRQTR